MRKLAGTLLSIHSRIPEPLRKLYAPLFLWRHSPTGRGFFKLKIPVCVFEGTAKGTQHRLCVAYGGFDTSFGVHWAERLLNPSFEEKPLGSCWLWGLDEVLGDSAVQCDLLICEVSALSIPWHKKAGALVFPAWVQMAIDIRPTMKTLISKSKKGLGDIRRRIRKYKLTLEQTQDEEIFRRFFAEMHKPFIEKRHADSAVSVKESHALDVFSRSQLQLVRAGDEVISGVCLETVDGAANLRLIGIKDAKPEYVKMGGIGAVYFFSMECAQQSGFKSLDVGGTSPLLQDGLTRFKRSLNAEITPHTYLEMYRLSLRVLNCGKGCAQVLNNNPIVYYPKGIDPVRAMFLYHRDFEDKQAFEKMLRSSQCAGLTGTHVYLLDSATEGQLQQHSQYDGVSVIRSMT